MLILRNVKSRFCEESELFIYDQKKIVRYDYQKAKRLP